MSDEERLGTALRSLLATADPVPPAARMAATSALSWRDLDAELAALASDSLTGEALAAVRGAPPRLLTFTTPRLTVDLEVTVEAGEAHILGQLSPAGPAEVAVEHPGGAHTVLADERGRFTVTGPPAGLLRVSVRVGTGPERVVTEWFRA